MWQQLLLSKQIAKVFFQLESQSKILSFFELFRGLESFKHGFAVNSFISNNYTDPRPRLT